MIRSPLAALQVHLDASSSGDKEVGQKQARTDAPGGDQKRACIDELDAPLGDDRNAVVWSMLQRAKEVCKDRRMPAARTSGNTCGNVRKVFLRCQVFGYFC